MKRTIIITFSIMSILLASCDSWPRGEFKWVNNSSHTIEVTIDGRSHKASFSLIPGQDTTISDLTGPMSPQTIEEHFNGIRHSIIGDTCKLQFDDGKALTYTYPGDTIREFSIYNLDSRNLSHIVFDKGWQSRFIYTIIDRQYETAE